jgi:hypothetical protein
MQIPRMHVSPSAHSRVDEHVVSPGSMHTPPPLQSREQLQRPVSVSHVQVDGEQASSRPRTHSRPSAHPVCVQPAGFGPRHSRGSGSGSGTHSPPPMQSSVHIHSPESSSHEHKDGSQTVSIDGRQVNPSAQPVIAQPAGFGPSQEPPTGSTGTHTLPSQHEGSPSGHHVRHMPAPSHVSPRPQSRSDSHARSGTHAHVGHPHASSNSLRKPSGQSAHRGSASPLGHATQTPSRQVVPGSQAPLSSQASAVSHGPVETTSTPARSASHAFGQVRPSDPQTGA